MNPEIAVPVSASEILEYTASMGFRTTGAWGCLGAPIHSLSPSVVDACTLGACRR